jgi:hypothetical protein
MKNRTKILLFGLVYLLIISSCCNEEDVYHKFPSHFGKYYEDNDTIVFYSEETDEYETYIVCDQYDGFSGDEKYSTFCNWVEYYQSIHYLLDRDSCDSQRSFQIMCVQNSAASSSHIISDYQGDTRDASFTLYDSDQKNTVEILGNTYYEVADGKIQTGDSLKSYLFSEEYGIIQYSFENLTFSLLRNESY